MDAIDLCFEDEILLSCARRVINGSTVAQHIEIQLAQGIDWSLLVQRAFYHRILPILYWSLRQLSLDAVPKEILCQLQHSYRANVQRNIYLTAELIKLIDWLWSYRIAAIPYKGPVMAVTAYGNIGLRQFGDIDILVHECNYELTRSLLLGHGFRLKADWGWECSLVDDARRVCVDLHQGIAPEQFAVRLDFDFLRKRLIPVSIATGQVNTLCHEDMLNVLCIQLAKDGWGQNPLRLSKVCDIAELLRAHPKIDGVGVIREARRLGTQGMLSLGLSVAHELFGTSIPQSLRGVVVHSPPSPLTTAHIYHKLFHEADHDHPDRLSMMDFHFKVRERWRDKLYPRYHHYKFRMIPNEKDRLFLRLPESLAFLNYLVRPVRLARNYGLGLYAMLKKKWFTLKSLL